MTVRIGITTSYEDGSQRLDRRYVTPIEDAGGTPVLLPTTASERTVNGLLDQIDGLVLPGGPAVTEGLVGSLPDDLERPNPERAESDRRWIERSRARGRPILGVCYGMQRLSALAGGTIYGDLEAEHDGAQTHSQKRGATTHPVLFDTSSRLREILDTETLTVNTRHLQAIATPGDGFTVAGRAPDGIIEAIEHESEPLVGVQFHPERMGSVTQPLFRALVERARSTATAPAR